MERSLASVALTAFIVLTAISCNMTPDLSAYPTDEQLKSAFIANRAGYEELAGIFIENKLGDFSYRNPEKFSKYLETIPIAKADRERLSDLLVQLDIKRVYDKDYGQGNPELYIITWYGGNSHISPFKGLLYMKEKQEPFKKEMYSIVPPCDLKEEEIKSLDMMVEKCQQYSGYRQIEGNWYIYVQRYD